MQQKKLSKKLQDKSGFIVVTELTGGLGFNFERIEKFLRAYKSPESLATPETFDFVGASVIPEGLDFVGITLPQNPALEHTSSVLLFVWKGPYDEKSDDFYR